MKFLRLWYRSDWVQPILLALVVVLIGTGIPLVIQHSRRRMDGFRVIQAATGVYLGVYLDRVGMKPMSGIEKLGHEHRFPTIQRNI
jgi:hypothetical protein